MLLFLWILWCFIQFFGNLCVFCVKSVKDKWYVTVFMFSLKMLIKVDSVLKSWSHWVWKKSKPICPQIDFDFETRKKDNVGGTTIGI